ncbi:MAG: peptidase M29, partial [Rhodospirillaceae bacterium]|nr:peptidase M29 [Rhodospirillaceae bacterium]
MLQERIEGKWINCFARVFAKCKVEPGEVVAILSESQSRPINVQLAELALHQLGAQAFHIVIPTPAQSAPVPVRSTGASDVIQNIRPVVGALASAGLVIDCTVEGLLHAPELPEILKGGARVLMVSNEHPEALERLAPDDALEGKVKIGMKMLRGAKAMKITSAAGSDLSVDLAGAVAGGGWGWVTRP